MFTQSWVLVGRRSRAFIVAGLATAAAGMTVPASSSASGSYHPDLALVAFERGAAASDRAAAHAAEGARVVNTFGWLNLDVVRLPADADPTQASARYERRRGVAYAEPNWEVRALGTPNDTHFTNQWGFHNIGQQIVLNPSPSFGKVDADIDAPEGWETAFGSENFPSTEGTVVGIIDTGIERGHIDLQGKTTACASALEGTGTITHDLCDDDHGHGTHVAGTIGAITNNYLGVAGTAPNAQFAVFKALDDTGSGYWADVVAGIHWAHTKGDAKVINMSLGGSRTRTLSAELTEAYNGGSGALLVAAAGNDGGDNTSTWPAAHADVVSVAATDAMDERAMFSNCNSDVELAAPGVSVWSTMLGSTYASWSGTSMATPHASGVAAMVIWNEKTTAAQTRDIVNGSVDDLGPRGRDSCYGYGRVNLEKALRATAELGTIAGVVSDGRTKSGIGGATIDCSAGGSATTTSDGHYSITSVPGGTYTCTAGATGYRSKSQSVTVHPTQTATANFVLRKN